jgi:tetratricopeptide (TPR) repeat protein
MINLPLLVCAMMLAEFSPAPAAERPPAANSMHQRSSQNVQLRPHTTQTGVFSAALGETNHGVANRTNAARNPAAANRTSGLVPQFMSAITGKVPQPNPSTRGSNRAATSPAAAQYAGSANAVNRPNSSARSTAGRGQPAYRTAVAAQSYAHPGVTANSPAGVQRPSRASRPMPASATDLNRARASMAGPINSGKPRPTAPPARRGAALRTSAAATTLIEAHEWAQSANGEAEFTKVFLTCRDVAIGDATAEEVAFSKELAAWALNRRGQIKAAAGRTDEALADFDTAIRLDANRWRAIHNRGVLLAQSGHFEQAFDDFGRTTELNPQFAKAYSNRAALYTFSGDPEAALRDYQRAVAVDPKLAVAQRGLGRTCHLLGMTGEALEHLDAAVSLEPNDAAALTSRGDLLTDLGYYADAADDFERALATGAESADACRSSAWLLATCPDEAVRNPQMALERAEQAVKRERKADAETYNVLAAAHASAGDYRQAVATIRQAIDLAPASERGMYEDRLEMYRQSQPLRIAPMGSVRQAHYQR